MDTCITMLKRLHRLWAAVSRIRPKPISSKFIAKQTAFNPQRSLFIHFHEPNMMSQQQLQYIRLNNNEYMPRYQLFSRSISLLYGERRLQCTRDLNNSSLHLHKITVLTRLRTRVSRLCRRTAVTAASRLSRRGTCCCLYCTTTELVIYRLQTKCTFLFRNCSRMSITIFKKT